MAKEYLNAESKKLTKNRLIEILKDTSQDCPENDFTAFEVYSMAKELHDLRQAFRKASESPSFFCHKLDDKHE